MTNRGQSSQDTATMLDEDRGEAERGSHARASVGSRGGLAATRTTERGTAMDMSPVDMEDEPWLWEAHSPIDGRCGRCGTRQLHSTHSCPHCGLRLAPGMWGDVPRMRAVDGAWRTAHPGVHLAWTRESRQEREARIADSSAGPPPAATTQPTTVFCEECGTPTRSTWAFCGHCGAPQESSPSPAGAPPRESFPQHRPPTPLGGSEQIHRVAQAPQAPTQQPRATENGHPASSPPSAPPRPTAARSYTICAIREIGDGPEGFEEGLLFPVPLDQPDAIATEPRDGPDIRTVNCTAISVAVVGAKQPLMRVRDIRAQVMLTDARITVACSKFDKGGGWWGTGAGAIVALPLNIGSHALAARRRRGKMLVGQVRFPWITAVYAQSRVGFGGAETLRVIANTGGKNRLRVDLTFPKNVDATAIGTELIRRAARFRLAADQAPIADKERARLLELTRVEPLTYRKESGKMAGHEFPTSWPASERSARFGLDPAGGRS
jgi:hypothetical protein